LNTKPNSSGVRFRTNSRFPLWRRLARRAALDAVSLKANLTGQFSNLEKCQSVQFIVLHFIQPYEEKPFADFLKWLTSSYDVVSYSQAVERINSGNIEKATAAISFDDGLKDNLVAGKIMQDHGVSGCFFVCPEIVGQRDPEKIKKFCKERLLYDHVEEFMDWDEIESLKKAGHEIGNHSQSHLYMMDLSEQEFVSQVSGARDEIVSKLGSVDHFAWTYGRFFHFHKKWVKKIFELGHKSCASAERGAHGSFPIDSADAKELVLRRDSIEINWPLQHLKYFLTKSTRSPIAPQSSWAAQGKS